MHIRGPSWPSGGQVWHLITGYHLCMGLTHTNDNAISICPNMTLAVEQDVKPKL